MNDNKDAALIDRALEAGFTKAAWLEELKLTCEPRLRAYCSPEGCPNHGNNWVCPPGCGTLESCAEKVGKFRRGLLLQSLTELDPMNKDYKELNRRHNFRLRALIESPEMAGIVILALTTGGCVFCKTCSYPYPCVKPGLRMNSLSAFGIDVGKLCEKAGWEYSFRQDRAYFIALVLI